MKSFLRSISFPALLLLETFSTHFVWLPIKKHHASLGLGMIDIHSTYFEIETETELLKSIFLTCKYFNPSTSAFLFVSENVGVSECLLSFFGEFLSWSFHYKIFLKSNPCLTFKFWVQSPIFAWFTCT